MKVASGHCRVFGVFGVFVCFFFNDTATTEIYTLSLHDALPISLSTATVATIKKSADLGTPRLSTAWAPSRAS